MNLHFFAMLRALRDEGVEHLVIGGNIWLIAFISQTRLWSFGRTILPREYQRHDRDTA